MEKLCCNCENIDNCKNFTDILRAAWADGTYTDNLKNTIAETCNFFTPVEWGK